MPDQELERVGLNLNQVIIAFWKARLAGVASSAEPHRFTANELRQFVNRHNFGTAPASADRIMRNLRKAGKINYVVVNRSKSLYEATDLAQAS